MTDHSEVEYVPVYSVSGHLAGEMVRLLLESMDIPVILRQESAGMVYGLTVGSLGTATICVPEDRAEEAMQILQAMDDGELENSPINPEDQAQVPVDPDLQESDDDQEIPNN